MAKLVKKINYKQRYSQFERYILRNGLATLGGPYYNSKLTRKLCGCCDLSGNCVPC